MIHDIFHISKLKRHKGDPPTVEEEQPVIAVKNHPIIYPLAILDSRKIHVGNKQIEQVLVQWSGMLPEDSSWEEPEHLRRSFPSIQLEGKLEIEEGDHDP